MPLPRGPLVPVYIKTGSFVLIISYSQFGNGWTNGQLENTFASLDSQRSTKKCWCNATEDQSQNKQHLWPTWQCEWLNKWIQFWRCRKGPSYTFNILLSTLCLKKTGPLRLIWHNFTNSQHLLIIFSTERACSILNWYNKKFINWRRTSCVVSITTVATWYIRTANFWADFEQRIIDRAIND